jgi:hypothetical protein
MKRFTNPVPQYFDGEGNILSGGKVYFYENGSTTTLKDTYNSDGGSANTNPVTLSAEGRLPPVWGDGLYTIKVTNSDGVQQWLRHGVDFSGSEGQFSDFSLVNNYGLNDTVKYTDGNYYLSLSANNIGNAPDSAPTKWSKIAFLEYWNEDRPGGYAEDNIVILDGYLYRSTVDDNITEPPDASWENLTFNNNITGDLTVSGTITSANQLIALKTSNQSIVSSTTLVDVAELSLTLEDNVKYAIRAYINWSAGLDPTDGIKLTFSGATHSSWMWVANNNTTSANSAPTANSSGGGLQFTKVIDSTATEVITFDAVITASSSPYKMRFAQSTSSVGATFVRADSYIIATRLN